MTSLFSSNDYSSSNAVISVCDKIQQEPDNEIKQTDVISSITELNSANTFSELGLCDWICNSVAGMGYKKPTAIQSQCIPAILTMRDVMGCAETGSGKTAAFALPILQDLSYDPYGIFCVVLTPTRELAIQIAEQFLAFGATFNVRVCSIIGGSNILNQRLELSKLPHILIATPGRLRSHIEGGYVKLNKVKYLVLDECDRLLCDGFASELKCIMDSLPSNDKRRTLIFSATLTPSMQNLEKLSMKQTLYFNITNEQKIPTSIDQQYIFVPSHVKDTYLVCILTYLLYPEKALDLLSFNSKKKRKIQKKDENQANNKHKKRGIQDIDDMSNSTPLDEIIRQEYPQYAMTKGNKHDGSNHAFVNAVSSTASTNINTTKTAKSIIIFVNSCRKCEEVSLMLNELGFNSVRLHSILTQDERMDALSKFKSSYSRILVATDVASRGLDIPSVEYVINMELPMITSDYIHRIGRTGRAGQLGKSLSIIAPHEIEITHAIEKFTGIQMTLSDLDVAKDEQIIIPYLNPVSKINHKVQLKIMESGFEDKLLIHSSRKKEQNIQLKKKKKLEQKHE